MDIAIPFPDRYKNKSDLRRSHFQKLANALLENKIAKRQSLEWQQEICRKIEYGCYKRASSGDEETKPEIIYQTHITRIIQILDCKISGSTMLCERLIENQVNPKKIAFISSYDLCPNEKDVKMREAINLQRGQTLSVKITTMYTCKCGNNECQIQPLQTRSLDEANGYLLHCIKCSRDWMVQ